MEEVKDIRRCFYRLFPEVVTSFLYLVCVGVNFENQGIFE